MILLPPYRSQVVHIPNTGNTGHYFIVLTKTCDDECLLVPICSVRGPHDETCKLGPGDNENIRHASYVLYARMEIYKASGILSQVESGVFAYCGHVNEICFAHVCNGVKNSPFSKPRMVKYYCDQTA